MPIPKWVAVFNKYVTNRLLLPFAGWMSPLAIVGHRGRNSGRRYRTPVLAFEYEGGFVFALTYGRDVDWVKNLVASDGGSSNTEARKLKSMTFAIRPTVM